jgi:hypothetical protein
MNYKRQSIMNLYAHLVVFCIKVVRITSSTIVIDAVRSLGTITSDRAGSCKAIDGLRAVRACAIIIVASASSAVLISVAVRVVDTTPRSLFDDRGVCIKSIADDSATLLSTKHLSIASSNGIDIGGALAIRNYIAISHGKTSTCTIKGGAVVFVRTISIGHTRVIRFKEGRACAGFSFLVVLVLAVVREKSNENCSNNNKRNDKHGTSPFLRHLPRHVSVIEGDLRVLNVNSHAFFFT